MTFMPQKAIKVQALADFLTANLVPKTSKLHEDITDKVVESKMTLEDEVWQMFFDGVSRMGHKGKIVIGVRGCCLTTQSCSSSCFLINKILFQ